MRYSVYALGLVIASIAKAQFPPTPENVTVLATKLGKLSYKQTFICETTPGVKAYSGYINLPASSLIDVNGSPGYDINTFFWFFESRTNPQNAPLAIYIQGGPGFNTISSVLNEAGPCFVNDDSNSTTLNPLSWNNAVNMLYIEQPVGVGFSYDTLTNATVDQQNPQGVFATPLEPSSPVPVPNITFQVGTFGSQNPSNTANSTGNAARVFWKGLQTWLEGFEQYLPADNKLSIWSESYGGRYVPIFADYISTQNKLIADGSLSGFKQIYFDTFGLINAWIDPRTQVQAYPQMAFNNTYGLEIISQGAFDMATANLTMKGGCLDQIDQCQILGDLSDPDNVAVNTTVTNICLAAYLFCFNNVQTAYVNATSKRSNDDITQPAPGSFPNPRYNGYLNQHWVQAALGAQVNFTDNSLPVLQAFGETGDIVRNGSLNSLAAFLDSGVKVALIYGDRDYEVNWIGGEGVSLSIPWSQNAAFSRAGYEPMSTNATYTGGLTRQLGPLSFTRVFQSGHQVASYQLETAYQIFMRAMFGYNIPTGTKPIQSSSSRSSPTSPLPEDPVGNSTASMATSTLSAANPANTYTPGTGLFSTNGNTSSFGYKDAVLPFPPGFCYVLSAPLTCDAEPLTWLKEGIAIVEDFVVVGRVNGTGSGGLSGNGTAGGSAGASGTLVSPGGAIASGMAVSTGDAVGLGVGLWLLLTLAAGTVLASGYAV